MIDIINPSMKLLLHACCADCILKFVDSIKESHSEIDEIVAYFYNPNIQPRSEYLARLKAIQKVAEENKINLVIPDWSPKEYFRTNPSKSPFDKGDFKKPKRCEKCWRLRLEKTFEYAADKKIDLVSSTLVTSHYQNSEKIKEIAESLEKKYKIKFLVPEKISKDLKTKGFYKQNYCGCAYSLVEMFEGKFA
jgi:predicted adenine nucleotide alpha hydrolase (AANH) superfamily ATPase